MQHALAVAAVVAGTAAAAASADIESPSCLRIGARFLCSGFERVRCSNLVLGWGMSMFQPGFRPGHVAWFQFSFRLGRRWGHVGGHLLFVPNLVESLLLVLLCFHPTAWANTMPTKFENSVAFFDP